MMEYGYVTTSSSIGILGGMLAVIGIVTTIISIVLIISLWKVFVKNNKPGWYSLIPVLNIWTMFEIVGIKGWWCLVPFANGIFMLIDFYKLPIKMGKTSVMGILNVLFPYVVLPILAFGKSKNETLESVQPVISDEIELQ